MLFSVKRNAVSALVVLVVCISVALLARAVLGVTWTLRFDSTVLLSAMLGFGAIVLADGIGFLALSVVFGEDFLTTYEKLIDYFEPQSHLSILAGGLLAASEELVFRGVLLNGLVAVGTSTVVAVIVSALAFGALHIIPENRLRYFALWAVWEGVLLGIVYVLSGSLLVSMAVHAAHDIVGFEIFAWQRRNGLWPFLDE